MVMIMMMIIIVLGSQFWCKNLGTSLLGELRAWPMQKLLYTRC